MTKDKLFQLPSGSFRYGKYLSDILTFAEKEQLLDAELWALFVRQYLNKTDSWDNCWRGEYWGKMMRGASLVYANTRNKELYAVLEKTVLDLLETQDEDGRITTYSKQTEFDGWDLWSRKYVLLGLQYFMEVAEDKCLHKRITNALIKHADYIIEKIGPEAENKLPITKTSGFYGGLNSSSILEPIVRMYLLTNEKRYLDFAEYIVSTGGSDDCNVFELAYENKMLPYQYPVTKAYEMMSCFEGLLEYYRVTGIEKWRIAVENFVKRLAESEITIIGCAGCDGEFFNHSSVEQFNTEQNGLMQETCVTVTWMKLCYQMLRISGDSFYADLMEESIFNAMLGSLNTERLVLNNGLPFDSYSPLLSGTRGREIAGFLTLENYRYYGCCAAIGSAGIGLIGVSGMMNTDDGIAINQYLDGQITFQSPQKQLIKVIVTTDFPKNGNVVIRFDMKEPENFNLQIRIPKWSKNTTLTVNGKEQSGITSGQYYQINKIWNNTDVIEITFDMKVYAVRSEEYGIPSKESNLIAFKRGALVLARDMRLGQDIEKPVHPVINDDGSLESQIVVNNTITNQVACDIMDEDHSIIRVVDYASAGKSWDNRSRMAVWLSIAR